MLSQPRTLVVTPVYCTRENQRLPLLLQCLYWVQHQTDQDCMHVVVNDGSTDNSGEILDRIAANNPRLLVYHQSNKGSSAAVNFGVEQALKKYDAQYITIIHSDDLLTPRSLEMRVGAAQEHDAKMVYSDAIILREIPPLGASLLPAPQFATSTILYRSLLSEKHIPFPTMLWKHDFFVESLQGYDSQIISAEDWDIALRSARELERNGDVFRSLPEVSVVNRQHAHNLWMENVRTGVRKKCCHTILAKHLKGFAYQSELVKRSIQGSLRAARRVLPESVKVPLRALKHEFFPSDYPVLHNEDQAFLRTIKSVDYQGYFASALYM